MAAAGKTLSFRQMNEAQLRQWVEANPGRVNDWDDAGFTPLYAAASSIGSVSSTVWLLDEKDADVNGTSTGWHTPLHAARPLDILLAFFNRGADPALPDDISVTALMYQVDSGSVEVLQRLLQDPRVKATVNVRDREGRTALHYACLKTNEALVTSLVRLLLKAGAYPPLINVRGETPLVYLRKRKPTHTAFALLGRFPHEQKHAAKAFLLIKARLAVAATVAVAGNAVGPSCLQARVAGGQPLPQVELTPVPGGQNQQQMEKSQKFRNMLAFLLGKDGPRGERMPRDVFRVVLDLLMPPWDPLRRKGAGTGSLLHV